MACTLKTACDDVQISDAEGSGVALVDSQGAEGALLTGRRTETGLVTSSACQMQILLLCCVAVSETRKLQSKDARDEQRGSCAAPQ